MKRSETTIWQALVRPPWRFLFGRWPGLATLYLIMSAVIGAVLSALFVITLLLLPLWGMLIGMLERRRTQLLGFPRQVSGHVSLSRDERHNWLHVRMTEGATWREAAAVPLNMLFGWIALAVIAIETSGLVSIVVAWRTRVMGVDARITFLGDTQMNPEMEQWWGIVASGLIALTLFSYVNAMLAGAQASLLRLLVGPRQRGLERNVARLTRSRATLVAAFEAERRRVERDLHDGVQQELVTLAARLGMVSLEVEDLAANGANTRAARAALDAAQDQAEHTMETLRRTVRGIHPAVLTDHGLRAALYELEERTPVPLSLNVEDFPRLGSAAETAAYYLVTESITNAAKHTAATRVLVDVRIVKDEVELTVTDNGNGGADENAGTGLRGLRERAETLGGTFEVESPSGGPTLIRMILPVVRDESPPQLAQDPEGDRADAHTAS